MVSTKNLPFQALSALVDAIALGISRDNLPYRIKKCGITIPK